MQPDLQTLTCDLWPLTSDLRALTCELWPATSDLQPLTCNLWPATSDLQPLTCNLWPDLFSSELLISLYQNKVIINPGPGWGIICCDIAQVVTICCDQRGDGRSNSRKDKDYKYKIAGIEKTLYFSSSDHILLFLYFSPFHFFSPFPFFSFSLPILFNFFSLPSCLVSQQLCSVAELLWHNFDLWGPGPTDQPTDGRSLL
jgi:hypothetical protein